MAFIRKRNIFGIKTTFVFKHKFRRKANLTLMEQHEWKDWTLGLFWKMNKIVGSPKGNTEKVKIGDKKFLLNELMIGINLLIIKFWVTMHRGVSLGDKDGK